jgi:hypothetical protein
MIGYGQSVIIGIGIVAASVAFLFLVDRLWPTESRRQHNDIVGWQVSVVGMTYAVIIGFMLYAVWTDFEAAQTNADAEADSLVTLARAAAGLPQAERESIQSTARRYAESMVDREWAEMGRGGPLHTSEALIEQMWAVVSQHGNFSGSEQSALNYTIAQLARLTEHRRIRASQSREQLPGILWTVLIVGAIITLGSSCLFGTRSFALHLVQVLGLSTLLSLALIAVAQIDRPFQGADHVSADAFIRAQEALPTQVPSQ